MRAEGVKVEMNRHVHQNFVFSLLQRGKEIWKVTDGKL